MDMDRHAIDASSWQSMRSPQREVLRKFKTLHSQIQCGILSVPLGFLVTTMVQGWSKRILGQHNIVGRGTPYEWSPWRFDS